MKKTSDNLIGGSGMISKRGLITGAGALFLCAPAIVRASSLMQIRGVSFSLGGTLNSDETRKLYSRIARLKDGLKADGLWDKLEVLWLFDTDPPTQIRPDAAGPLMKLSG